MTFLCALWVAGAVFLSSDCGFTLLSICASKLDFCRSQLKQNACTNSEDASISIDLMLVRLRSLLASGIQTIPALCKVSGIEFATPHITFARVSALVRSCCACDSEHAYIDVVSSGLTAAITISQELGCKLATNIDAVRQSYRTYISQRQQLRNALTIAKATALILAVLPFVTLGFSQLLGAHGMYVLFHTAFGWGCLAVGFVLELLGLTWIYVLIRKAKKVTGWLS